MFIGHFAVGFAAKRTAPKANLAWLLAAPSLADLLWPLFVALGWERFRIEPGNTVFTPLAFDWYPWSHSLVMLAVWGAVLAGIYFGSKRDAAGAVVLWLGVVSHWVLDVATHRADMPLWPGGPLFGLALWNHKAATVIVESAMLMGGLWIYIQATRAKDKAGSIGFWAFVAFLVVAYVANAFGPPPPSASTVTWVGLVSWLLLLWIAWFDGHRQAV
jgi:hypothetical protein